MRRMVPRVGSLDELVSLARTGPVGGMPGSLAPAVTATLYRPGGAWEVVVGDHTADQLELMHPTPHGPLRLIVYGPNPADAGWEADLVGQAEVARAEGAAGSARVGGSLLTAAALVLALALAWKVFR